MTRLLSILTALVFLTACNGGGLGPTNDTPATAAELFAQAEAFESQNRYARAVEAYEQIQQLYPHDPLAVQAQFQKAMALHASQKYGEAIVAFDEFLAFNPGHPLEIEAVYFRARSFYDEIPDVFRDQAVTQDAKVAFLDLIERFPGTARARDAEGKLVLIYDQLAGHEMVVGRTYQSQNQHLAAQNRFKEVIEEYPTTTQVPEAFYRLVETSLALGLAGEARRYGATLGYNYPSSQWYHRAYDLLTDS